MNLNEAAEIVRKPQIALDSYENSRNYIKAWELLANTALSWLDPTPITEDWLRENPHIEKATNLLRVDTLTGRIAYSVKGFRVKTLGELRTLLRLCTREKENDA